MEKTISIRNYRKGDEKEIVSLLSSLYESIKCTRDWERLYADNPDGTAVISLAEDTAKTKLIGHYSAIKMHMNILGIKYLGSKGEGEIFDTEYVKDLLKSGRKFDISTSTILVRHTLDSAVRDEIKIVCTNPSDLALKSHLDAGFKVLKHNFSIFVLVLNEKYLSHLLAKKIKFKGIVNVLSFLATGILKTMFSLKTLLMEKPELEEFDNFNNETDRFAAELNTFYSCINIQRSQKHLNWRFEKKEYKKFFIKYNKKIIGYIVLHVFVNPNGFKEANLVDYLVLPQYWANFKSVITGIVETIKEYRCDFLRVNYVHDFKENFHISRTLKNLFFLPRPDKRNIVVFLSDELKPQETNILNINNWFFTDLYFEGY